jgi:hypothetical protein
MFMVVFIYHRYKSCVDKANVQQVNDTADHNDDNIAAVNSTEA